MNNQEYKVSPEIIHINSNEPSSYPYSVEISKCSGSCNNINDPHAKLCVPDVGKNTNVEVFNLILAWKFGKFREMIHRYCVCTPCGNDEMNFCFPQQILAEAICKQQ